MKNALHFFVLLLSLDGVAVHAVEPKLQLPPKQKVHLYLLIGQSNMAGRGTVEEADKVQHPRVITFKPDLSWAPAVDPLHFDKSTAGVGLGSSFGRAMADAEPEITIGLIPCAVGGTPLAMWQKKGVLYQKAVERAKAAMADGTLRGILWHQGENDAASEETAKSYGERLAQMVGDMRAELGAGDVPFVAGQLGEFLWKKRKTGSSRLYGIVNEQIDSLPTRVKNTAVVSSEGLAAKSDGIHFDSPALREFGKRYAVAMQKLQAAAK
jgi:hypothetical protein